MRSTGHTNREWWTLASILAVASFLRFFRLGSQSLWIDELLTLGASTTPPGASFWLKLLYDVHGPLHTLIIHFMLEVSQSTAWLRAPSAVAGVLSVFFLYQWLVVLNRKDLAPFAAVFMALNPFHLYYSQELRFYSLLALFVILALIAFERFVRDPTMKRGGLLGITLVLACLSHFSALFLGLGFLVYLTLKGLLRGKYLRAGALAALIVLVVISPWIYREITFLKGINVVDISTLPVEERLRGELTMSAWSYPYTFYALSVGYSFGPSLRDLHVVKSAFNLFSTFWPELIISAFVFGWLLISGLVGSARQGRLLFFLSIILSSVAVTTVITIMNIKVFNVRYLMVTFPIYIALLTYGLPAGTIRRFLMFGVASLVMLVADWNYHFDPRYAKDDVRGAVRIISDSEKEGDLILVPVVKDVFDHYYHGSNSARALYRSDIHQGQVQERIETMLQEHPRIWYLRCRHRAIDPNDTIVHVLSTRAKKVTSWELPGVRLILYERSDNLD